MFGPALLLSSLVVALAGTVDVAINLTLQVSDTSMIPTDNSTVMQAVISGVAASFDIDASMIKQVVAATSAPSPAATAAPSPAATTAAPSPSTTAAPTPAATTAAPSPSTTAAPSPAATTAAPSPVATAVPSPAPTTAAATTAAPTTAAATTPAPTTAAPTTPATPAARRLSAGSVMIPLHVEGVPDTVTKDSVESVANLTLNINKALSDAGIGEDLVTSAAIAAAIHDDDDHGDGASHADFAWMVRLDILVGMFGLVLTCSQL